QFSSHDLLIEYVHLFCGRNGYSISIARSKQNKVYLGCDREEEYRNRLNHTDETRKKEQEAQERLNEMTKAGIRLLEILSFLWQNDPLISTTLRDIYNIRKKVRQKNLQSHMSIQALLEELEDEKFEYDYKYEKEDDYLWALVCLSHLFDEIEKPKEAFLHHWSRIMKSKTEENFNIQWAELCSKYNENLLAIYYIQDTWLPFKEQFVSAWTDHHFHLGNTTTSHIESAHGVLKKYLQVSTGDLHVVYEKILLLREHQYNEIKAMAAQDKVHILHTQNIPFYSKLITKVSIFALKKLHEQYLKAICATSDNLLESCSSTFTPQQATARNKLAKLVRLSSTSLLDPILQYTRG
ncbi:6852_t:CDS:2, partial [Cetraspora pellucida]